MDAVPDNTGACPGCAAVEWGRKRMIPRDKMMENPLGKQTKTAKITKVKNETTHPGVSWPENAVFSKKI
ncbi:hypothetical protein DW954_08680 [Clostridium sp. AM45-5]|nr:hypothetical protein [Clostridium sp. AM45-5]RHS66007.1 hypothetical protein DW954_08680 [Clostridium sp. AM45-5]